MRVILFESISANGMIARPTGRGDFFTDYCWTGFVDIAKETGALVWGRTTHDLMRARDGPLADLEGVKGVVLTHDEAYAVEDGWTTAASPETAVEALERQGASELLVVGGQTVNTAFAAAGLLDEVTLFVESVLVGQGLTLFADREMPDLSLRLLDVARPTDTVVRLRYAVPPRPGRR